MGFRRAGSWSLAGVFVLAAITACNTTGDLVDDYKAGYSAGQQLYDDPQSNEKDQQHCQDKTREANGGEGGWEVDSSDEATVYWNGCLNALGPEYHGEEPSAEELRAMISDED